MRVMNVNTKKQFKQFIHFPLKIYSKNSQWVQSLNSEIIETLFEDRNPFWMHAKRTLFLAYDDCDDVVGRIAAIIDYNYISFRKDRRGFFGFFESFDDIKVAKALFLAVKQWLGEQNIYKMIGPMNPSINGECGFLSHGFDIPPSFMMPYTPQYYLNLAEQSGLKKIKGLYAYDTDIASDSRVDRLEKVITMTKKRFPVLKIRTIQKDSFEEDLKAIMSIYNCAWEENWGFVPWTSEEFSAIASKLRKIMDPNMIIIASMANVPIGMLVSLPDYNQVLKKLNGRLLPFGIFKFLYYRKKIDGLRLMVMGVIKEYRHKGVEAIMCEKGLKNALMSGYKRCELSWVLDDNVMTQRTAKMMNGKLYKKYVIYGN